MILRYAYPLKTLVWATVTRVQDALFYQASGLSVADAVDAAREASNDFGEVFGQLLCMCQRDYLFLNRTLLNIHFQLGHLVLVDALPPDFIFIDRYYTPYDLRLCVCRSIITALKVALQTEGTHNILLLDPHPELITNAIIRTGSSMLLLHRMQKMSFDTTVTMFSVVPTALKVLSNISYTALTAIPRLRQEVNEVGLDYSVAFKRDDLHAAVSVTMETGQSVFQKHMLPYLEQQVATPSFFTLSPEKLGVDSPLYPMEEISSSVEDLMASI
ncbi:hypothetical protein PRZ48_005448 [Zasmidium cellare]|uniref:Uncharacterized protein n=1 Tax=Zasmidium cellare TaxID=395010 RepID=A0ABR0ESS3_ZASCE|nr:hypothetical protein PRZ48_005448 [Zasmidium cellare]